MAKYTDPNTGVKYSTHTGLKVFTVIVVILLVISVVLNAVLFMQSSDDSVVDSSEGGEFDKDGQGGDSSEGGTPEPGEGIVDTETIIENEYAVRTSEFDEYGAATCLYYYYYENIMGEKGTYNGCEYCEGPCKGHECWITKSGAVYDSLQGWSIGEDEYDISCEPDVKTQVLYAEDGSTDINSKIRVSLVFKRIFCTDIGIDVNTGEYVEMPYNDPVEYIGYYYTKSPQCIEISSLTDEPLEIESVEIKLYSYYEDTGTMFSRKYTEYRSESGIDCETSVNYGVFCPDATTVYFTGTAIDENKVVISAAGGEFLVTLTLSDGNSYSFRYWCLPLPDLMVGAEVVYID